ncbi:MAG: pyridoxamine 5'-phosphate oxidase family protein [Myxococcales bacterium]|nr:pyridoxamine 5'-phosphate oxidase family protein [Myxococcales bacterium]
MSNERAPYTDSVEELLRQRATLELATSSEDGLPWLAAAYFAARDPFTLVMMLEREGRTMQNIAANPRVAIMIQDGNPTALFAQAEGVARMVEAENRAFADLIAAKTPESAPLVRLPHLVGVQIDVQHYRLTDLPRGWLPARDLRRPATRQPVASA